jgi:hypothetical protein
MQSQGQPWTKAAINQSRDSTRSIKEHANRWNRIPEIAWIWRRVSSLIVSDEDVAWVLRRPFHEQKLVQLLAIVAAALYLVPGGCASL